MKGMSRAGRASRLLWVASILGSGFGCAPMTPLPSGMPPPAAGAAAASSAVPSPPGMDPTPMGSTEHRSPPPQAAAPAEAPAPPAAGSTAEAAADRPALAGSTSGKPTPAVRSSVVRGPARWAPADWAELPGWGQDDSLALWPALLASCTAPAAGWGEVCARALLEPPTDHPGAQRFLMSWLAPWRLEDESGQAEGLATGYFEPVLEASLTRREGYTVALHEPPADLALRQPHWSRRELQTRPEALAALAGREIAWLAHPLDLLLLQIQGSGRLRLVDADAPRQIRVAYAGHNGHPYRSVGRWLIEQGELRTHEASWPGIRQWAARQPHRLQELMWANPRVIYFRAEPLSDPAIGPRGAQGVPLTPGRSVAVDPRAVPYGTPLWIDTTEPLSSRPMRRLVMAQDTGSAIVGAVRIDYFWGWGDAALEEAGRMRQPLRAWALWPKGSPPTPRQAP